MVCHSRITVWCLWERKAISFFLSFCLSWPQSDRCTYLEQVLLKVSSDEISGSCSMCEHLSNYFILRFKTTKRASGIESVSGIHFLVSSCCSQSRGPKHKTQTPDLLLFLCLLTESLQPADSFLHPTPFNDISEFHVLLYVVSPWWPICVTSCLEVHHSHGSKSVWHSLAMSIKTWEYGDWAAVSCLIWCCG